MYVASFYCFAKITELERVRDSVEDLCNQFGVRGTCILAKEGINAALAHSNVEVLDTIVEQIKTFTTLPVLHPTISRAHLNTLPFDKLLVRVRPEIVSFGTPFDFELPALPKVNSVQWSRLLQATNTVVLDVRNQYEFELGRFRNSIQPRTKNFREFKSFLQQRCEIDYDQSVGIYCTGGIRCEKAAQSMFKLGYKSVVQLDRGILGYLEETTGDSLWEGECFVFDQRVALNDSLMEGTAELCLACGGPLTSNDKVHPHYEHGISCAECYQELTPATVARRSERLRQLYLTNTRKSKSSNASEYRVSIGGLPV